jgi:hypothetical protein
MLKGYNNMNTNTPNPFATEGSIVLSGAGRMRKNMGVNDFVIREMFGAGMDGAGFFDDVKKGYNKTKSAVKSKTGQKIVGALKEDKDFMKEFNKAKKQLMDYQNGVRKTKPGKMSLAILEQAGVISKIEDEFRGAGNKSGKISRIKKANKWRDFSVDTAYRGVDLARYGYENFKEATNPVQAEAKKAAKGIAKMFGGAKRSPSNWVMFVKDFSQKHNIPYKEALSKAGPSYRQLKNKM